MVIAAIGDRPAARAPDDDARTHAARGASALHYRAFAANPDDPGRTGSGARLEDGTHNGTPNGTHALATLPPPDAAAGLGGDAALARATRAGAADAARAAAPPPPNATAAAAIRYRRIEPVSPPTLVRCERAAPRRRDRLKGRARPRRG